MKNYSDQEIVDIRKLFEEKVKEQEAHKRRVFYKALLIALAILATGFIIGLCV